MKGLIIKDLKLIKSQRLFLIIVIGICIVFLTQGKELSTVLTYASAVFSLLSVSTIGYDEHDNGMGFLFTFPISRQKYVLEKYVLGILLVAAVFFVGGAAALAVAAVKSFVYEPVAWFSALLGSLLTATLIISLSLPIQMKFGSEKGRFVLFILVAFVAIAGYGAQHVLSVLNVDLSVITERILQANIVEIAVGVSVLIVVFLGISYMVSLAVMKRKQF